MNATYVFQFDASAVWSFSTHSLSRLRSRLHAPSRAIQTRQQQHNKNIRARTRSCLCTREFCVHLSLRFAFSLSSFVCVVFVCECVSDIFCAGLRDQNTNQCTHDHVVAHISQKRATNAPTSSSASPSSLPAIRFISKAAQ